MRRNSAGPSPEIQLLVRILDEAYSKQAWHGPNLKGSIRGLPAKVAAQRPAPDRHNIWEIMIHAAYWKYAVRRRLLGEKRGSFPLKGSNWIRCPEILDEKSWKSHTALLDEQHVRLREAISSLSPSTLHQTSRGSRFTNATLIYGIAAHDLYHAGQIQLLKRLLRA